MSIEIAQISDQSDYNHNYETDLLPETVSDGECELP